tara:strand:+ start:409 stop:510 length:102 start_codon:yes stop_codon:yes gene_type:complete
VKLKLCPAIVDAAINENVQLAIYGKNLVESFAD